MPPGKRVDDEVDFRAGKRGPVISNPGKTRITIFVDTDVLDAFRAAAEAECRGYQTAINDALRATVIDDETTLEGRIRKIVREELRRASRNA